MRSTLSAETKRRLRRNSLPLLLLATVVAVCFYPPSTHAQDDQKNRQKSPQAVPVDWGVSLTTPGRRGAGTINNRLDALYVAGAQRLKLALTDGAAAHVARRHHAFRAQQHGAAGAGAVRLGNGLSVTDFQSGYGSESRGQICDRIFTFP